MSSVDISCHDSAHCVLFGHSSIMSCGDFELECKMNKVKSETTWKGQVMVECMRDGVVKGRSP